MRNHNPTVVSGVLDTSGLIEEFVTREPQQPFLLLLVNGSSHSSLHSAVSVAGKSLRTWWLPSESSSELIHRWDRDQDRVSVCLGPDLKAMNPFAAALGYLRSSPVVASCWSSQLTGN